MSFNLTDLKKQVETNTNKERATHYHRKIVIGSDFFSVIKFLNLRKDFASETRLLGDKPISKQTIQRDLNASIRRIRTEIDAQNFQTLYPNIELRKIESTPKFYKDGELKEFGGKAEPMQIKKGEHEFISQSYQFNLSQLIDGETWENLDQILKDSYIQKPIISIEKTENNDLAEPRNYQIETGDEEIYFTEEIFYGDTVHNLLNFFTNKNDLGDDMVHFLSSYETKPAIELSFILKEKMENDTATFLFPRSQTHERGHYAFEFTEIEGKPALNALIIIHNEEYNEEDLAKKIRHFKTTLKRYYQNFEENIEKEHILFNPEFYLKNTETLATKVPSLHLNLPLTGALEGSTYLAKPLLMLR